MKKITFLKTFIQTRWLHNFKTRAALEAYQKKQLSNYMDFLKRESPYFKNGVPTDFDHMDKTFMMTHFNELNTQGIDRDEALALAIESEKTRDFTELSCWFIFRNIGTSWPLHHDRERAKHVGGSYFS